MTRRAPREIELSVAGLDPDGQGVGSHAERIVRVKNALPGETVIARVLKRRRGVWHAEATTPESGISPIRQPAPCVYFPRCGGCAMQHLRYQEQLALKQQQLLDELERSGVSATAVVPPRSGPQLGYRTKARLGVRVVGESVLAGFRETYSNRVARMDSCEVLIPRFSRLVMPLRQLVGSLGRPDLVPQLELAAGDRDAAVVIRHLEELRAEDIAMLEAFERAEGVRLFLQPGGYDSIVPLDDSRPSWLGYTNPDFGLHYRFLPWDFTQVNLAMNRRLVREALLHAGAPAPRSVLLDLFCGIGNFSLAAASLGWRVTGIEASEAAVARARLNAGLNGLGDRCEFLAADLYDPATDLPVKADCLILDPPRSGAGPNLGRWVDAVAPERIVYVSCQPATFAGDAAVLAARGYRLERVGIFDMFPHTAHVETLGSFRRSW